MDSVWTATVAAWVLGCLVAVGICVPALVLGPAPSSRSVTHQFGAALAWTWLTVSVCVPIVTAVRGLNWATALLIALTWPAARWLFAHRGEWKATFQQRVRAGVYSVLVPGRVAARAGAVARNVVAPLSIALVPFVVVLSRRSDIRLPVPADFDTLSRTQALLTGTPAWDPVASLTAFLTYIAAVDAFTVTSATRLGLIALTGAAACVLITEVRGRSWWSYLPLGAVAFVPALPMGAWALALAALIGSASSFVWRRDRRREDAWHSLAAAALVVGLAVSFADGPGLLVRGTTAPQYLEHGAAPNQAIRLAHAARSGGQVIVAPPEQQLETDGLTQSYDLARFVTRYRDRTGDSRFRFDMRARRLFVFVEIVPLDVSRAIPGVRFVADQPAAYRVPRERARLARLAKEICDEYRRTHSGVSVEYEDAVLRVYRIDL